MTAGKGQILPIIPTLKLDDLRPPCAYGARLTRGVNRASSLWRHQIGSWTRNCRAVLRVIWQVRHDVPTPRTCRCKIAP